jgi:diguanylate cyclase (GGDEF)-like protein
VNLDRYRSSFTVFVAISDLNIGAEVAQQLGLAGYNCEQRLNYKSLTEEIQKNPPHIIVMSFEDQHFFAKTEDYKEHLEALQNVLPETQIIFLTEESNINNCGELYQLGIYDCLSWPPQHSSQLLRAVDRACETNYFMYLNEHLRDQIENKVDGLSFDPAMFQVWLKELEASISREDTIELFLKESMRYLQTKEGLFFRYREIHQTLALTHSIGVELEKLDEVGIDLAAHEPGFLPSLLLKPHLLYSLQEFVTKGLLRQHAVFLPLIFRDQVIGIFVLPATPGRVFRDDEAGDSYLGTCLMAVRRHFEMHDLQERLQRLSVYDYESEAYQNEVIQNKLKEEVVRSRRLLQPVSVLLLQIDGFADMSLAKTAETTRLFLKAFHEVMRNTSRINDLVGRLSLDQFVICLPHTAWSGALIKAERIRRTIESADFSAILGSKVDITASIGVSEYPNFCHDAQDLLKTAETALVEVTRAERNRVGVAVVPARFVPDFVVKDESTVSPVAG